MATLNGAPPKLTLNLDALESAPGLNRRRGLSVTGQHDDHQGSPAKRGPGAALFSFGGAQNAAPAGSSLGLSVNTGQQPSTGAFGSTTSGASTPGAFGAAPSGLLGASLPPASAPTCTPATAPAVGGTFGGGAFSFPPKPATSSPFGGTAPAAAGTSTGAFGSTPASTASFGATSTAAPSTGTFGSSFGGTSAFGTGGSNAFGSTGGTNAFGQSTSAAGTGTGLFGSTSTSTSTGTSAFGLPAVSTAPTTNTFGQSTGSNLFGSSTFGQAQPSNALVPSSSGAFGSFGASQPASVNGLLGASQQQLQGRSLAASTAAGRAQRPEVPVGERLMQLRNAWDKTNPACRFQYFFYNVVAPDQVRMYARPPLAQNEAAWQQAVRANPAPDRLVPVLAVGFSDLSRRATAQDHQAQAHLAKLSQIGDRVGEVSRKHGLETAARLDRLQAKQSQLTGRLTHLVAQLHPLTPLAKSSIRPEEETLARRLQDLKVQLDGRGGQNGKPTVSKAGKPRLAELWALVGQRKAAVAEAGAREEGGWAVIDETELAKVLDILSQQQAGLDHLVRTLKRMTGDLNVMRQAFGLPTTRPRGDQDL